MDQIRQGDVLLVRVSSLPEGAKKQSEGNQIVLAYGEATGHSHTLITKERPAVTFLAPDGSVFLQLGEEATITHQEHGHVIVDPGIWIIPQQVEYVPKSAPRRVSD